MSSSVESQQAVAIERPAPTPGPKQGVYYQAADYAGIAPRLGILVIDSLALMVILTMAAGVCGLFPTLFRGYGIFAIVAIWLYEVPLKRSSYGTLGYRLLGYKIVNLQGQRPSLFALTFRAMLWLFGPFAMIFDLLWCGMEIDRQSMRDCFASTYVVKSQAEPIGVGPIIYAKYFLLGYNLMYPRVKRPNTELASPV